MCKCEFFICEHCKNLVEMIHDAGVSVVCCGQKMKRLAPSSTDSGREKHAPVVTTGEKTVTVSVGSVEHPMTEEHGILWVCLQTDKGVQRKRLESGKAPRVTFALSDEKPTGVFAFCNLHGLWWTAID